MSTIKIYGASDDLLEVEGGIREEFSVLYEDEGRPTFVGCSDGTLIKAYYDGEWNLKVIRTGSVEVLHIQSEGQEAEKRDDGTPGYSDVVIMEGHIDWVVVGRGRTRP